MEQLFDPQHLNDIFDQVKNAGRNIIELKGRTNYAIGLGLTRIVESIIRDENSILTVSSLLEGYHGINDVCLSVPTIINRAGIREAIILPLTILIILGLGTMTLGVPLFNKAVKR